MAKTITIGRSPQSSIVVGPSFETVSNNHAEITLQDDGRVRFTDHSSNGTVINGIVVSNRSVYVTGDDVISLAGSFTVDWLQVCALIPELAMAESKRTQRQSAATHQQGPDDIDTQVMSPKRAAEAINGPAPAPRPAAPTGQAQGTAPAAATQQAPAPAPAKAKAKADKSRDKVAESLSAGTSRPFYKSNLALVIIGFIAVMAIIAFTVFDDVVKNIM